MRPLPPWSKPQQVVTGARLAHDAGLALENIVISNQYRVLFKIYQMLHVNKQPRQGISLKP